jgi:HAD superfamily hydrolase (TIGR01509 family)
MKNDRGRRFRAAIFDLDGLLIDSEPLWQQAEIECFGAVGVELTRAQAQDTLGLRSDEVVCQRFDEYGWDEAAHSLDEVEERIIQRVVELIRANGKPMNGVYEALEFVETRGLRLAVASSSRIRVIEAALAALKIADRFELIHSAELELLGKPHPGVYQTTARKLDLLPAACVAFEDSPAGLESAKEAGMACVAIPDESIAGKPVLSRADLILPSLADLDEDTWAQI